MSAWSAARHLSRQGREGGTSRIRQSSLARLTCNGKCRAKARRYGGRYDDRYGDRYGDRYDDRYDNRYHTHPESQT